MTKTLRRMPPGSVARRGSTTSGTSIFTDNFTGTDGAALSATYWTLGYNGTGTGAAVAINTNRARFTTGSTGNYNSNDRMARRYVNTLADFDVTLTFTLNTGAEVYPSLGFRMDATNLVDSGNGYWIEFNADALNLVSVISGTYTTMATVTKTHTTGTAYKLRVYAKGTTIQAKTWLASGSEPGTWDIYTTSVTMTAAGYWGLAANPGGAATTQIVYFDDVIVTTAV